MYSPLILAFLASLTTLIVATPSDLIVLHTGLEQLGQYAPEPASEKTFEQEFELKKLKTTNDALLELLKTVRLDTNIDDIRKLFAELESIINKTLELLKTKGLQLEATPIHPNLKQPLSYELTQKNLAYGDLMLVLNAALSTQEKAHITILLQDLRTTFNEFDAGNDEERAKLVPRLKELLAKAIAYFKTIGIDPKSQIVKVQHLEAAGMNLLGNLNHIIKKAQVHLKEYEEPPASQEKPS